MFELEIETHFSSAHHLLNYKGKCENLHGHNWKVLVAFRGEKLNQSNILVDFKELKAIVNEIVDYLDHKDLNELDEFKNISPSSEIIAKYIYFEVKKKLDFVYKVSVFETETSKASYFES